MVLAGAVQGVRRFGQADGVLIVTLTPIPVFDCFGHAVDHDMEFDRAPLGTGFGIEFGGGSVLERTVATESVREGVGYVVVVDLVSSVGAQLVRSWDGTPMAIALVKICRRLQVLFKLCIHSLARQCYGNHRRMRQQGVIVRTTQVLVIMVRRSMAAAFVQQRPGVGNFAIRTVLCHEGNQDGEIDSTVPAGSSQSRPSSKPFSFGL